MRPDTRFTACGFDLLHSFRSLPLLPSTYTHTLPPPPPKKNTKTKHSVWRPRPGAIRSSSTNSTPRTCRPVGPPSERHMRRGQVKKPRARRPNEHLLLLLPWALSASAAWRRAQHETTKPAAIQRRSLTTPADAHPLPSASDPPRPGRAETDYWTTHRPAAPAPSPARRAGRAHQEQQPPEKPGRERRRQQHDEVLLPGGVRTGSLVEEKATFPRRAPVSGPAPARWHLYLHRKRPSNTLRFRPWSPSPTRRT